MPQQGQERLILAEYPILFWLIGGIAIVFGLFFVTQEDGLIPGMIALAAGMAFALFLANVTTLIADKPSNLLTIRTRSLILGSVREYALDDIGAIEIERTQGSDSSPTYRITIVLKSGERVPLHSYYSSGYANKYKKAHQISRFLGLPSPPERPTTPVQAMRQALQESFTCQQEGETSGVHWRLETSTLGSSPITRWVSPDFQFPGQFLFLVQKQSGQKDLVSGGLLGTVSNLLFHQLLGLYGFPAEDTPGETSQAASLTDLGLGNDFIAFASNPAAVQEILTPWAANYLEDWARDHPIQRDQSSQAGLPGQLVVLFAPQKLYLAVFGPFKQQLVAELTSLGAGLVRESGRGK